MKGQKFLVENKLDISITFVFMQLWIEKKFNQIRKTISSNLDKNHKTIDNCPFQSFSKHFMMIINFLNKHNTFILIPHFDILKPFFLWIDHKAHLFSFLNYFKIVKYILIFINPHLLQNNLLLIFHQPIYPFIIDLNAIICYDIYCLLNQ